MKNIHVLPTEKPSRLFYLASNLHIEKGQLISPKDYKNIYITSDEEIKEGDWCYNSINNNVYKKEINKLSFAYEYKIILTTDQDLNKDGVQKIDDEFLEWFIKNPSCEEVEIRKEMYIPQSNGKISDGKITHEISLDPSQNTLPYYKISIPKEEQKQHLIDIVRGDEELGLYEEPKQTDEKGGPITFREGLEVSKYVMGIDPYDKQEIVKDLAYWKANAEEDYMKVPISVLRYISELEKQKYSEEEVLKLLIYSKDRFGGGSLEDYVSDSEVKNWFEQLKKK